MITCNGIVGPQSLFVGAVRYRLISFNAEGTGAALATVTTLAVLTMVRADLHHERARPGVLRRPARLRGGGLAGALRHVRLDADRRHRDFFLPVTSDGKPAGGRARRSRRPTARRCTASASCCVSLVAVVGLAKVESPAIESAVAAAGFPQSFVGVVIALLVLLPETLAAVRAAQRNRIQISLNLALGSAMASIGLTIPAIALASIWLDGPLLLGLGATQMVLLALTVVVSVLTVVPGRATRLQGGVHLVLLAAFVFLAVNP